MDRYVNSYLISDFIPQTDSGAGLEPSKSHFFLINRLGKIQSKFGWQSRIKLKLRIKQSNGDIDPDLYLVKFEGSNFGILKLSKQVLIKRFRIEGVDFLEDSFLREKKGVVLGYQSEQHGLIMFVKSIQNLQTRETTKD